MKLASTIGFLFGTHNIANDFVTIDPSSGFTRKRYLSSRRTQSTELVQRAHPKLHIEAVVGKVMRWLFVVVGAQEYRWTAGNAYTDAQGSLCRPPQEKKDQCENWPKCLKGGGGQGRNRTTDTRIFSCYFRYKSLY
jgi:hypothetical protein